MFGLACNKTPIDIDETSVPTGIEVSSGSDLRRIQIRSEANLLVAEHQPLEGVQTHWYPVDWSDHKTVSVTSRPDGRLWTTMAARPKTIDTLRISAPLGQPPTQVLGERSVQFATFTDAPSIGISLSAVEDGPISIKVGQHRVDIPKAIAGETVFLSADIDGPEQLHVIANGNETITRLEPIPVDPDAVLHAIHIKEVRFPTDHRGRADFARPEQAVSLSSGWWAQLIRWTGLSFRPRDRTVPWGHQTIRVQNESRTDLNLLVRARVTQNGEADPVFIPKMRDVDDGTGWASVLLHIRAEGTAETTLPIFVDERLLEEDSRAVADRVHQVEVAALGGTAVLAKYERPLAVERSSTTALAAMAVGLMASVAGFFMLGARLGRWLSLPTPTLVTIALFGTLSFVVNSAVQLIGMGVASLLGPFAFILTGLLDDTIRAVLLIVLLNLRPAPGVCALSVLIGWLLRAVTMGSASPTDFLYLTSHIFFLETALWASGITRGRPLTGIRVGASLSLSFSASIATALAFNVVFYRLFYADWYIALNIGLSGLLYPAIATGLALPVAKSLILVED